MRWTTALLFFALFSLRLAQADEKKPVPDFKLIDQDGKTFQLHDLKGSYVFITFVYTRCPSIDMCPRAFALMRQLLSKWNEQPNWKKTGFPIKVLAITLDPAFDTPSVMKVYAESQGLDFEKFTFATGDPKDLVALESQFNVLGIEGADSVAHTMKGALLSPVMVPLREYKDNNWTPEKVLSDMRASVAWWKWFYALSALLAIPGLLLLWWLRSYSFEAPATPATPEENQPK